VALQEQEEGDDDLERTMARHHSSKITIEKIL
jgi:hypothetical protein